MDFETYKDRLTSNLSGGEKRKVALASILAIQSDILLLDEPLSGLDPFSTGELLQTLSALHQEGKTLLISTHQYEEFISLLNDITVINKGQDRLHGSAASVFSRVRDLESAGLKAPLAARIASRLREKGWPIAEQTVSFSQLESQLTAITRG
jgi:energy-coupling factor transport system ATP-binding protein